MDHNRVEYSSDAIKNWQPFITKKNSIEEIRQTFPCYEIMLLSVLDAIIKRYRRDPEYHFIDTKLDLLTGCDFEKCSDPEKDFKGKGTIYSWIQGRGLEALAGHAEWLEDCKLLEKNEKGKRIEKIRQILREVSSSMEELRARNNGHLFFSMSADGRALEINDEGKLTPVDITDYPVNFSDLFYAKGLFAAGDFLRDESIISEAGRYYEEVLTAIKENTYKSDQQAFDPKNKVKPVAGQIRQGPWMIALGGIALFLEKEGGEKWEKWAEVFLNYILDRHVNHGQFRDLPEWGFIEILDENFQPWEDDGSVLSDTGHALEFIGLALKVLFVLENISEKTDSQKQLLERCREELPQIFEVNFNLGFNPAGGIYKAVDLKKGKPINTDMPWWSLPETMRAAAELLKFSPESPLIEKITAALCRCSDAFMKNYVNKDISLMAYQTLDKEANPVRVIPATPDADPGYHTGLSIIDFLKRLT